MKLVFAYINAGYPGIYKSFRQHFIFITADAEILWNLLQVAAILRVYFFLQGTKPFEILFMF